MGASSLLLSSSVFSKLWLLLFLFPGVTLADTVEESSSSVSGYETQAIVNQSFFPAADTFKQEVLLKAFRSSLAREADTQVTTTRPRETPEGRKRSIANCVINSVAATGYLGVAAMLIESATSTCLSTNKKRNLCVSDIFGIIGAFAAVASFISGSAASCTSILDVHAGCASTITGLVDAVFEATQASNALATHCVDAANDRMLQTANDVQPANIARCVIDTVTGTALLSKAGLQINAATLSCNRDSRVCSANALGVIGSLLSGASFLAALGDVCVSSINNAALCAADITQLVSALHYIAAAAVAMENTCGQDTLDPDEPLGQGRRLRDFRPSDARSDRGVAAAIQRSSAQRDEAADSVSLILV
eukprot:TRINITY_DN14867_c0_g1_i1.p1 TRINITY_DN14867_c0_g1~~TRINITY_DN14867_c0_g1_i1.p1  ORF type:complete len:364 (+),score=29.66 TRINITY_DN14867_c0_g1_i1:83-1174(+)